jgi:hypothetical protein
MYLKEVGWKDVEWIRVAQDRVQWRDHVITVVDLRIS